MFWGELAKARWKVLLTDARYPGESTETTDETVDARFRNLPSNFVALTRELPLERRATKTDLDGL